MNSALGRTLLSRSHRTWADTYSSAKSGRCRSLFFACVANDAVCQLWIFGSRARGDAREGSDIDIALALAPPVKGRGDPALGAYFHLESEWKQQLQAIVGIDVSLSVIVPGEEA